MKSKWIDIGDIFGGTKIPVGSAFVVNEAVKKALRSGDISRRNKWQLVEYLCAEYLLSGEDE